MKPIHLNLASQPYRDYRKVYAVALVLGLISGFLLLKNIQTAYQYLGGTRQMRTEIALIESQTLEERRKAKSLEERLKRIDSKSLNAQTRYINTQIAERAFSWSELLDRLEVVVPNDVRLLTLNPEVGKQGIIKLELSCAARSANGFVEMLNRLLADPHFARPFPRTENVTATGHAFTLEVEYRPEPKGIIE